MTKLLLIWGLASIATALVGTLLALYIQHGLLSRDRVEREAWEDAQEAHQLNWEKQQRKRTTDIEWKLLEQVEQIQEEWTEWQARDQDRTNRIRLEYELRGLPTVDEIPLTLRSAEQAYALPAGWQPPMFEKADLRGRDFSQRYLGHAYLREADLSGANFYMADLRNACLVGANLSNVNLTGANLSGADLRGATLCGATLLVSDLRGTLLHGANLLGVRSLTIQQVHMAHYDHTTLLESEIDVTMPRLRATPTPTASASDPGLTPELIQHIMEAPLLLPPTSNDSPHDAWAGKPAADTAGSTEAASKAVPTVQQNGTRRAKAG